MTTTMTRLSAAACVLTAVTAVTLTPSPPAAQVVRIVQTNSAGDNVHLIDPATNTIVGEITGVEVVHGVAAAPDGTSIWSTSKINSRVYAYSLPDLDYLGAVKVGTVPDWLTFTPDGRFLYVANAHDNYVSVIDVKALTEIKKIQVGQVPKRNITATLSVGP